MEVIKRYFPDLSEQQLEKYQALEGLYLDWNSRINVISRKDTDQFYLHHVLHSLAIAKVIQFEPRTMILDVGTGGGFPAIPLAIMFPNSSFLAIDSISKKIKVVNAVIEALDLKNIKAGQHRAEEIDKKFDFIVSRAVTRTNRFISWVDDKFKKKSINSLENGYLFIKGGDLDEELNEAGKSHRTHEIKGFFEDSFFETKKVIYMPHNSIN